MSWKQENPKLQAIPLVGSLEGHLENAAEGVITLAQLLERVAPILNELRELHKSLPESWDGIEKK